MASPNPLDYIKVGADVLGGLFGGLAGGDAAAKAEKNAHNQTKLGIELGRRGANLSEGQQASEYERRLSMAPLRDRLLYNLTQRAGMPSMAFQPTDMFNPAISQNVPQLGGIDRNALAGKVGAYQQGAGGVNTAVMQRAMEVLGYRPDGSYMSPRYRSDVIKGGVDPYGIEAHGYTTEDRHDYKGPSPWDQLRNMQPGASRWNQPQAAQAPQAGFMQGEFTNQPSPQLLALLRSRMGAV